MKIRTYLSLFNGIGIGSQALKELDIQVDNTSKDIIDVHVDLFFFRYITTLECERLRGYSDFYTESVSKTQRMKQCGNGWTLPVIKHILSKLKE